MEKLMQVRRGWLLALAMLSAAVAGCAGLTLQDEIGALMKEGQALYSQKRYSEAVSKFGEVVAKDPTYWTGYVWLARSFIASGNWRDAIGSAQRAYAAAPQGADVVPVLLQALFGGGADALKNGQFNDSIKYFVEYLKLQPGNASAWLNVGRAYIGQGQFGNALDAFVKGLARASGTERQELLRGMLDGGTQAFSRGQYRDAIGLLREYLKSDSRNVSAYLNLAKSYWQAGDRTEALQAFREVLKLSPANEEALRFMLTR